MLQGGHREATWWQFRVSAVDQEPACFNQKAWKPSEASLSVVLKCVFDARTGILGGLMLSSGRGIEQDYW